MQLRLPEDLNQRLGCSSLFVSELTMDTTGWSSLFTYTMETLDSVLCLQWRYQKEGQLRDATTSTKSEVFQKLAAADNHTIITQSEV